jgi:hypothetical protein
MLAKPFLASRVDPDFIKARKVRSPADVAEAAGAVFFSRRTPLRDTRLAVFLSMVMSLLGR